MGTQGVSWSRDSLVTRETEKSKDEKKVALGSFSSSAWSMHRERQTTVMKGLLAGDDPTTASQQASSWMVADADPRRDEEKRALSRHWGWRAREISDLRRMHLGGPPPQPRGNPPAPKGRRGVVSGTNYRRQDLPGPPDQFFLSPPIGPHSPSKERENPDDALLLPDLPGHVIISGQEISSPPPRPASVATLRGQAQVDYG